MGNSLSKTDDSLAIVTERYIDLWLEQAALMASEPAFGACVAGAVSRSEARPQSGEKEHSDRTRRAKDQPADQRDAGPDAAAHRPASDDRLDQLDGLRRRLAECQARFAAVASKTGEDGG